MIKKYDQEIISLWDDTYPFLLKETDMAPPLLFYKGDILLLQNYSVSIVGTRNPTEYGRKVANKIAEEISERGITVVSGLALGVDTISHKGALKAKGKTVAVLPSPINQITPFSNRKLAKEIEEKGLLISEYPPKSKIGKQNFYLRNRIISGISRATIVVEAGEKSGALITAAFALEQNREVFAIPGNIFSEKSRGTNKLLHQGATPFLSTEEFLSEMGLQKKSSVIQLPQLEEDEQMILEALGKTTRHLDELMVITGMDFGKLFEKILSLETTGYIEDIGGNYYRRKK